MEAFVKKYRNDVPCFVISRFLCYEVDVVQGVFEAVGDKGKEQGGARMGARKVEQFIYIVGEHQDGMIAENDEIFAFTREKMAQVETRELAMVIANVFAKGQYFPGPDGALSSVIHEFVRRSDRFRLSKVRKKDHCALVTALKRFDGEISVKVAMVVTIEPGRLKIDKPESFHQFLVATIPQYQEVFLEEAYAKDSKLIDLIKETTLHHINMTLQ